jgi:hypothetical protein
MFGSSWLKEYLKSEGKVTVYSHSLLPRTEKIFTKEKSTLAKQSANVLLSFISGNRDFPRLINQKTVHFIIGERQGEKCLFVSPELFEQLKEEYGESFS